MIQALFWAISNSQLWRFLTHLLTLSLSLSRTPLRSSPSQHPFTFLSYTKKVLLLPNPDRFHKWSALWLSSPQHPFTSRSYTKKFLLLSNPDCFHNCSSPPTSLSLYINPSTLTCCYSLHHPTYLHFIHSPLYFSSIQDIGVKPIFACSQYQPNAVRLKYNLSQPTTPLLSFDRYNPSSAPLLN